MIIFKFLVTTLVTSINLLKSNLLSVINLGKAIDAKLQTATSSGDVYSIISVHKLDDLIVPKFF